MKRVELVPIRSGDLDNYHGIAGVILAPPSHEEGVYVVPGGRPADLQTDCRVLLVSDWREDHAAKVNPGKRPRRAAPLDDSSIVGSVPIQPILAEVVFDLWATLGPVTWAEFETGRVAGGVAAAAWCGTRAVAALCPCHPGAVRGEAS